MTPTIFERAESAYTSFKPIPEYEHVRDRLTDKINSMRIELNAGNPVNASCHAGSVLASVAIFGERDL